MPKTPLVFSVGTCNSDSQYLILIFKVQIHVLFCRKKNTHIKLALSLEEKRYFWQIYIFPRERSNKTFKNSLRQFLTISHSLKYIYTFFVYLHLHIKQAYSICFVKIPQLK